MSFRSTLFAAWNFNRRPAFNKHYVERLDKICRRFLAAYQQIEDPQFPPNFGALTPRSQEAARKAQAEAVEKMKKALKYVEVTKDALVNQCIADICALEMEYEEQLGGNSPMAIEAPPVHERTRSVGARIMGLFGRSGFSG